MNVLKGNRDKFYINKKLKFKNLSLQQSYFPSFEFDKITTT